MTRDEHLAWCKARALEYVDRGNLDAAWTSMLSDLGKHPETRGHAAIELGSMMMFTGNLNQPQQMRDFIEGFN